MLDIVGSHERTMPTLLQLLDSKTCIVNLADNPVPCDGSTWDGCVVDRQMFNALEGRKDAVKGLYLFSSRWPPLDPSVVNGVDRTHFRVRAPTSPFNIFVAARMDRLGPDDWRMLWEILRRIPEVILHFYGLPMFCINGILGECRNMDEKDRHGSQNLQEALKQCGTDWQIVSLASRIKFMGGLPLPLHIDRLRNAMDAVVAPRVRGFDGGDVYTHISTCLTAGLIVLSVGGRGDGGELELLGLECLVLGNDDKADVVTDRIIRDLIALRDNRSLGNVIREHLDRHAREGTSFFDQYRFPEDIKALIQRLAGGGTGVLNCETCKPEPQAIARESNRELVPAGSPDPPFSSQPPDSGELWSEIYCPMNGMAICEGPDSSGSMDLEHPLLKRVPEVSDGAKRLGSLPARLLRSHGLAPPGRLKLAGSSPQTIDLASSNSPVARPRPLPMTLPLTIFHCRLLSPMPPILWLLPSP